MRIPAITTLLLATACVLGATEAQETQDEKAEREARVKARLAEHAARKAEGESAAVATEPAPDEKPAATADEKDTGDVSVLPEFTVSSTRISELDVQIKKLNKQIDRAKKKLKPSELDETLNSDDAPKALAIFGGKTSGQRKSVAAERVNLMEAERDILEAMKHVRTKKDEDQLKEQLNAFKTMRRELDEVLR